MIPVRKILDISPLLLITSKCLLCWVSKFKFGMSRSSIFSFLYYKFERRNDFDDVIDSLLIWLVMFLLINTQNNTSNHPFT